jgi:X-Pro dipeptidyl-peptidase
MRRALSVLLVVVAAPVLAGCTGPATTLDPTGLVPHGVPQAYDTSRGWSVPLSPALYELLPGVKTFVPSFDETSIALGLFFPKMDGCDWAAETLPAACHLPVVMDAGPYWADIIEEQSYRPPLIEWLVPRGYVVAHMSVRGTGESGGCMETMSLNEQQDVDAMVTWLGQQPWSNGNVGMMGRSYDGSTPFFPAATGNPYLKTIVPISGVPSEPDLLFKNGTSEVRGPIFTNGLYWAGYGLGALDGGEFGYRAPHYAEEIVCPDVYQGTVDSFAAAATGQAGSQFWQDRNLYQRVLDNYKGSIWVVHGLEDWNVNPSQVAPFWQHLQDKGLDAKLWYGVWAHAYPDRMDEHRNVRWDWADQTVRWFDKYLKGDTRVDTGPAVEIEDSLFVWRAEQSFPPRDATWTELAISNGGDLLPPAEAQGGQFALAASAAQATGLSLGDFGPVADRVGFATGPLERDLRFSGLPQVHVTVTPTTPGGGYLFAELWDLYPDGHQVRLGWAAMNLRFHEGGNTQEQTLTPGTPVVARMEMEPLDAHVGAGHRILLVLQRQGIEDIVPTGTPDPIIVDEGAASVLRLPVIERPSVVPSYTAPGLGR